jgi:predicted XRE-type DNA-binding protein
MGAKKENVFKELGFDEQEAIDLEVRTVLLAKVIEFVRNNKLTQQQAADFFGVHRPKISDIMRGKITGISAGYLIKMLLKTGGKLDVRFRQPTKAKAQKLIKGSRAA